MSKSGKVGIVVFVLFSVGAVISSLRIIGNIEEKRKEIEGLRKEVGELEVSLEEKRAELVERNAELEEKRKEIGELEVSLEERSAELAERNAELARVRKDLEGRSAELAGVRRDLEGRSVELARVRQEKTTLEEEARKEREEKVALEARLKELLPEVAEAPPGELPLVRTQRMGGKVMSVAGPFLSLELDEEVVNGQKPTFSIYRRGSLIKEVATKGIQRAVLIARVSSKESLEGIREGDQVSLSLSPGTPGIFSLPHLKGEVLDIISPGFLNIDLGKEELKDIELTLVVYRGGELFREIELKDINRLTISAEVVEGINIGGIKKRDMVKLIP